MSSNNDESTLSSILSTFSLTIQNSKEKGRFEKLASLKKILQKELNKSITIDECDAVLLAGALLLNDTHTVKEQSHLITDINIRLWGNAVDPLSKWITQHQILPQVRNMNKFIEGNTPLHFAVLTGNFENIAFLLSKQADPFLKNAHGHKPLQLCQDYHRKLHGHGKGCDRKRKRKGHKSLKKSKKHNRKSHKRSKSCKHSNTNSNNTAVKVGERSNSYDNDADDENDSDFYYNNDNVEDNDGDESSSESQSPMHLSCKDFDQLFSNAVKNMSVDSDKEGALHKIAIEDKHNKVIQKKNNNNHANTKIDDKPIIKNSKKSITHHKKGKNKSKLKCKTMRKCKNKKNHNGKNRNKNKRINTNNRRNKKHNNRAHKNNTKHIHKTINKPIVLKQINKPIHLHKSDSISISSTHSNTSLHSISSSCTSTSTTSSCTYSDTISSISTPSDTEHSNSHTSTTTSSSDTDSDTQSTQSSSHSLSTSTSVTLSDTENSNSSTSQSHTTTGTGINSVEINIQHKNGKIIKSLSITKNLRVSVDGSRDSSSTHNESESSTNDEIYITSDMSESSSISSINTTSSSSTSTDENCNEHSDNNDNEINKLLQQSMQQTPDNSHDQNEHDLHSQLVPIIIALSEINIFAESASLARIVKFICTLIFFVALHWLEGNSAAKMIVKVFVSIIYLAAMFGHRINEWKECIDAETVLRKQQWSKTRDKERQKRKEKLQKTLRSVEVKRCVVKKQRKLERDTFFKQDIFDWRARIRMMINHAESAFIQCKWEMAEIYFSRLLGFLMENNEADVNVWLNERKRANLKINRRWKGVFEDHYSMPIAKMFSRRAYCLCKIKEGDVPHGAPVNDVVYKTVYGHLELAVKDLGIAIALREISPVYQKFVKVYRVGSEVCDNDIKYICEEKLDVLIEIMAAQLCDLISLAGLYDLKDEFEKAYEHTLQADDIIHCLNKFNKEYIVGSECMKALQTCISTDNVTDIKTLCRTDHNASELESKRILATIQNIQQGNLQDTVQNKQQRYLCLLDNSGNFKLCLNDIIPLKDIEPLLQSHSQSHISGMNKMNKQLSIVEELKECSGDMQRSKSMISLLQISRSGESKFYSLDIDDGKIILMDECRNNKLELMDDNELEKLLSYPLRRKVDLNGYKQLIGKDKCSINVQQNIDQQLKKIRLLRLQAANRQRAVNLKHKRAKMKHNKANVFSMLSSLENEKKKQHKKKDKDKANLKAKNNKIDKIVKVKTNKIEKVIKSSTKHINKNGVDNKNNAFSASLPIHNDGEDEVKIQHNNIAATCTKVEEISQLKLIKSQIISMNMTPNPCTPNSNSGGSGTSSVCSDATSNATSSIKSDKDDEETKMSMVMVGKDNINNMDHASSRLNHKNKNKFKKKPQRRSQIKLKKLKKKNKNKIGKKKTKKNQQKNTKSSDNVSNKNTKNSKKLLTNDDNDERLSVSSEFSKSPSMDSLSVLSESTSSDSINNKKSSKNVPKLNKNNKNFKSPSKKYNFNQNNSHRNSRNVPARQTSQHNRRSPKDNNKHYRKKNDNKQKKTAENDDDPRVHWLWNVKCDFYPNCRNSRQCPFRHPTDKGSVVRRRRSTPKSGDILGKPINCRFGRDCSRMDCWFWHPGDDETFIDPSSIPTSPQTQPQSQSHDAASSHSSHSHHSHHSDPSIIGTNNTSTDHYESVDICDINNDNKVCDIVSDNTSPSAVIITKKPITNPWHKSKTKSAEIVNNKNEKIAVLSPTTFNNKKILSRHDSYNNNMPLTAPITVGAIYHNEFDILDYDINNMIRPPTINIPTVRAREQKVKSSLNPHANAYSAIRKEAQNKIPSAPIRPPMRSHFFDNNKSKISPPFDPHSQLQNGGVFTPHNTLSTTTQTAVSSTSIGRKSATKIFRLGTGISNDDSGWNGNGSNSNYAVDEYKQAPMNYNNSLRDNTSEVYYDYGDESKVVESVNDNNDNSEQTASHPWICPSCSFLNEIGATACELCSSLPPNENSNGKNDKNDKIIKAQPIQTGLTQETQTSMEFVYDDDEELHRNLSFNSLFYGNSYTDNQNKSKNENDNDIERSLRQFNEGDRIMYRGGKESIEGIIVAIRDIKETPWPIKIEYYSMNEFGKKRKQFMWVLPRELIKVDNHINQQPQEYGVYNNDDELYDYEDEEDDNDNGDD